MLNHLKPLLYCLVLLVSIHTGMPAQSSLYNVKQDYANSKTTQEKLYHIGRIVKEYSDYRNCDSINRWLNIAIAEKAGDKAGLQYKKIMLTCLGVLAAECREDYGSIRTFIKQVKEYNGKNKDLLVEKYTALFLNYRLEEDYEKAYETLRQIYTISIDTNKTETALYALYHLSVMSDYLYNYNNSRKYLEDMYTLAKKQNNEKYIRLYRISIGRYHFHDDMEKYDSSLYHTKKYYRLAEKTDLYSLFQLPLNAAEFHIYKHEPDSASRYLSKAAFYLNKMSRKSQSSYYYVSGLYCSEFQQAARAVTFYKRSLSLDSNNSNRTGDISYKLRKYILLSEAAAEIQDFKTAYAASAKALFLGMRSSKVANKNKILELDKQFQTQLKEKENALLKAENINKEIKLKRKNIVLLFSFVCILLAVMLLFFILKNYTREKRYAGTLTALNKTLHEQHSEITMINGLLQLKVLRTQMNPHFIYNSLNAINHLILKGNTDRASDYLLSFSKLLRMVLDFSDKDFIDLEEEITFLGLYLSLEAMRLGTDFKYDISVDPELLEDDISLPSLLIQPFIENAIWHGFTNKEGHKKISVSFNPGNDDNSIICIVDDNGVGRKRSAEINSERFRPEHQSKGIRITQERIDMLTFRSGDKITVNFTDKTTNDNEPSGTRVELILPVNTK